MHDRQNAGLDSTVLLPLTTHVLAGNAFPLRVRVPAGVCGLTHESDVLMWDDIGTTHNAIADYRADEPRMMHRVQVMAPDAVNRRSAPDNQRRV